MLLIVCIKLVMMGNGSVHLPAHERQWDVHQPSPHNHLGDLLVWITVVFS